MYNEVITMQKIYIYTSCPVCASVYLLTSDHGSWFTLLKNVNANRGIATAGIKEILKRFSQAFTVSLFIVKVYILYIYILQTSTL